MFIILSNLLFVNMFFCLLLFVSPFGDGFYNLAYDNLDCQPLFCKMFCFVSSSANLSRPWQRPQT
ncbi:hypothetical protein B1691_05560 [Geobacillus sp. 47C-IIb]|nr:hypothetical protein GD3902_07785 [Geobacillus thermodenitrificans]ATO39006.1 hypothetical protein GTID1_08850 [Geobacillus thermodenitrificans]OQP10520.1 hypothetical protein B1691_05560 [Geobacillus sp. 47C-IIb]